MIVVVLTKQEATAQITGTYVSIAIFSCHQMISEPGAGTLDFTYAMTTFTWQISVQSYLNVF